MSVNEEMYDSYVDWMDINDCVDFLKLNYCKGLVFHGSNRRILIIFNLSKDETQISFVNNKSGTGIPMIRIDIGNVKFILKGQQGKGFKKWDYEEYENRSLSIFYGEGKKTSENDWTGESIHIICDSEKERDILVNSILFIQRDKGKTTRKRNQVLETNVLRKERLTKEKKVNKICVTWNSFDAKTPEILPFLDIHDVVFGVNCTFVITQGKGDVYSWGEENHPKLGHRRTKTNEEPTSIDFPQKINFSNHQHPIKIIQLSTRDSHTLFLEESGRVWGCGSNQFGQLGLYPDSLSFENQDNFMVFRPTKIPTKIRFCQIACSSTASAGIEEETWKVFVWGDNTNSLLGLGSDAHKIVIVTPVEIILKPTRRDLPVDIYRSNGEFYIPAAKLCAGPRRFSCLTRSNNVYVWGLGIHGNGKTHEDCHEPNALKSAFLKRKTADIACGANFSSAVTKKGKLYLWGARDEGQCGDLVCFGGKTKILTRPSLHIEILDLRCISISCGEKHMVVVLESLRGKNKKRRVESWGSVCSDKIIENDSSPPPQIHTRREVSFLKNGSKFMKQMNKDCGSEGEVIRAVAGGNMSGVILKFETPPLGVVKQCMCCRYTFKVKKKRKKQLRRLQMVCCECECIVCSECCSRETLVLKYGYGKSKICKKCFRGELFPGEKDLKMRVEYLLDQIIMNDNEEEDKELVLQSNDNGMFELRGQINVKSFKSLFL